MDGIYEVPRVERVDGSIYKEHCPIDGAPCDTACTCEDCIWDLLCDFFEGYLAARKGE